MASLSNLLTETAGRTPQAVFLRTQEGDLTYAEVEQQASHLAAGLQRLGVGPDTTAALMMENSLDQVLVWFALNRIGAVHVPLNTALRGGLLEHQIRVSESTLLIVDHGLLTEAHAMKSQIPSLDRLVVRGAVESGHGIHRLDRLKNTTDIAEVHSVDELEGATMLFTSGTTGPSKPCVLSHRYLVRQGQLHAKYMGLRSDDVLYCPFPLFHIDAASLTVSAALAAGATAALGVRFSVSGFWDEVRAFDATVFNFMGATLALLWKSEARPGVRDHRVRLAWGVPLPQWQHEFESRFGFPLRQVYGSTDAGIPVYDPIDGTQKPGAAGRVIDEYEVIICDGLGRALPTGSVGEIVVRGREPGLVMNGYHGMPHATAKVLVDGWVHTGDLGSLDEDGYLTFHGRATDSIRRRGENISAFEVEQMVAAHPKVLEVAAVGVPSELTEEDLKVVVVLKEGKECSAEEIHWHCSQLAPRHMVPRYIELVQYLPKTPTEKVEKFRLKEIGDRTWDSHSSDEPPSLGLPRGRR